MKKLSIFSWYSYPDTIEERLKAIKQAGFDATMLWWAEEDKHTQPDLARSIGLEVENIHAPFKNVNSLWHDGIDGDDYLNVLMKCVEDCMIHEIPTMVVHITGFSDPPELTGIGLDRVKRLVDHAERKHVNLAFENLHYLQHLDYILKNFNSDRVGFCYDSGHENWNHPTANCLSKYGDKLMALHLDDNFGNADTHLLPFDGNVNWERLKQDLTQCRELEYISLEVDFNTKAEESKIYEGLSAMEFLQKAFERASKLL